MSKRLLVAAAFAAAATFPSVASANTYCVGDLGCELQGGTHAATIQGALDAAKLRRGSDVVRLGAKDFAETVRITDPSVELAGAGQGLTTISSPKQVKTTLAMTGGKLHDLTIRQPSNGVDSLGADLEGVEASDITVLPPSGCTACPGRGMRLWNGSLTRAVLNFYSGNTEGLDVEGQFVRVAQIKVFTGAGTALAVGKTVPTGAVFSAMRLKGLNGMVVGPSSNVSVSDTAIDDRINPNGRGLDIEGATFQGQRLTLVGNGGYGVKTASLPAAPASADIRDSIIDGYSSPVTRYSPGNGASVELDWVMHPALHPSDDIGPGSISEINPLIKTPQFVDRAAGDFHLAAGSPGIDAGGLMRAGGERDADGLVTPQLDGTRDCIATADMGAYEYAPTTPTAVATAPATAKVGKSVHFDSSASCAPLPSTPLQRTWHFDDGTPTAAGPLMDHVFTKAGTHKVTVTVDDGHGTDTKVLTVVVTPS